MFTLLVENNARISKSAQSLNAAVRDSLPYLGHMNYEGLQGQTEEDKILLMLKSHSVEQS